MAESDDPPDSKKSDGKKSLDRSERLARFVLRWLRWVILLALAVIAVEMGRRFWPNEIRVPRDPSLLDRIFLSRSMVFAVRLVILIACVYLIGSVIALITENKWLSEVGPFKASKDPVGALTETADTVAMVAREQAGTILTLEGQVDELKTALQTVSQERDEARSELTKGQHEPA